MAEQDAITMQLWEIVTAVATDDMTFASECDGDTCCIFCIGGDYESTGIADSIRPSFKHEQECLVIKAQKLLAILTRMRYTTDSI